MKYLHIKYDDKFKIDFDVYLLDDLETLNNARYIGFGSHKDKTIYYEYESYNLVKHFPNLFEKENIWEDEIKNWQELPHNYESIDKYKKLIKNCNYNNIVNFENKIKKIDYAYGVCIYLFYLENNYIASSILCSTNYRNGIIFEENSILDSIENYEEIIRLNFHEYANDIYKHLKNYNHDNKVNSKFYDFVMKMKDTYEIFQ